MSLQSRSGGGGGIQKSGYDGAQFPTAGAGAGVGGGGGGGAAVVVGNGAAIGAGGNDAGATRRALATIRIASREEGRPA
jgi:hypothetical protein